jgi:ABC-type transport system substrate-binding protein
LRWLPALTALLVLAGCGGAAPPPAPQQPPAPVAPPRTYPQNGAKQLAVGVDDLGTGFNPHLISDVSPTSSAVAGLVLPSVFRPATDGSLQLDSTVATSAKVTSTAPFTVSYELNVAAAWSDNAPIAAEDFVYLWQQMRAEPGVVDNAGYRLITDVRSRAGGKAVDVVFSQPDDHWQELFSNLLPAHVLKDAPVSWRTALADSIPVSGGPFLVSQVDRARGQLVLMRNDHYWGTPSVLDSLTLRRTDATSMVEGLRSGDLPVVQSWADTSVIAALGQLGSAVRLQPVAEPIVVQLGMRTDDGLLSDVRLRQAVGALLNRDQLIAVGTGNGAGGVPANAQLLAPSEPGYRSTAPAGAPLKQDPALATQLLTSAGYAKDAQGRWSKQDNPLKIVIGVPAGNSRFLEIAQEAQRELVAGGIEASLVGAPGPVLFTEPTVADSPPAGTVPQSGEEVGPPLAGGPPHAVKGGPGASPAELVGPGGLPAPDGADRTPGPGPVALGQREARQAAQNRAAAPPPAPARVPVDLVVMPRAVGSDVISTAVSNYGCPPGMAGVAQPARNATGFCSPGLQPTLSAALAGGIDPAQAAASIEATLWQQLPAIPLFQVVTTVASTAKGDHATGNIAPGPLALGPFSTAVRWQPVSLPKPGS